MEPSAAVVFAPVESSAVALFFLCFAFAPVEPSAVALIARFPWATAAIGLLIRFRFILVGVCVLDVLADDDVDPVASIISALVVTDGFEDTLGWRAEIELPGKEVSAPGGVK